MAPTQVLLLALLPAISGDDSVALTTEAATMDVSTTKDTGCFLAERGVILTIEYGENGANIRSTFFFGEYIYIYI